MLFGHQNDDTNQTAGMTPAAQDYSGNPLAVDPATGVSLPVASDQPSVQPDTVEPTALNQPPADDPTATAPVVDTPAPNPTVPDVVAPDTTPEPPAIETPVSDPEPAVSSPTESGDGDLLGLKQQAIAQLSPLVGQLEQTPEEKFRTTMMMIQSTDNQGLIKDAYEAAQQITDEKSRAQALLDVINEINYFTQAKTSN